MSKSALSIVQKYAPNVTRVVDATRDAHIEVTRGDCKGAKKGSPNSCAMARAFEREYDGAVVSLSVAYLIKGSKATRYRVPNSVSREIVSFDRAKEFSPGEYHLRAPVTTERLESMHERNNAPKTKRYAAKRRNHKTAGIRAL